MISIQNVTAQRLVVFFFATLFILLQTCFFIKGGNYFLIIPSIFLILTYKSNLLGYRGCFILGLINDIFSLQLLGVSSLAFVIMKYLKTVNVSRSHKDYVGLLIEYIIYSFSLFLFSYSLMLMLGVIALDFRFLLSLLLLALGFFVCDFLWLKIFGLFNVNKKVI